MNEIIKSLLHFARLFLYTKFMEEGANVKKGIKKAYAITDAKIQFVSLVDSAANKRSFLLTKGKDGKANFSSYGRIIKTDLEHHFVTGIVYEPMTEDTQGNFMTEEEITKAAYWFSKNGDQVDLQHSFEPLAGATVVENWIAKADFKIGEEEIHKGTWLMTVEITDANVWNSIEKGEITGFSMGGLGNYSEEDIELEKGSKQESSEKKGLLKQLATALGIKVVEKGTMAELYEERSKGTLFWNALNTLEEVLYSYDNITGLWRYETNEEKVRECLEEFNQIITAILTGKESITKTIQTDRPVKKAGKKMSSKNQETLYNIYESLGIFLKEFEDQEEESEVKKSEVESMIAVAIQKAMSSVTKEDIQKTTDQVTDSPTEITQETMNKMVETAIAKATQQPEEHVTTEQVQEMITAAVAKAIDPVLKSKGLPSNLNDSNVEKAASEEHYLHGIL